MAQPSFAWWPWRTLSAAVGLLASLLTIAGVAFWFEDVESERAVVSASLAIFAGGNALILGSAMGDFGRTVQALMVSIGVTTVFTLVALEFSCFAPFVLMAAMAASLAMDRSLMGFAVSAVLGVGASLIGFMMLGFTWILLGLLVALFTPREEIVIAMGPVACAVGNVFTVGFLFNAAHRVRTDRDRGGVEDRLGELYRLEGDARVEPGIEGERGNDQA